jgi:ubiquinone/menaquinone biosynthesis C-methylase UbiE
MDRTQAFQHPHFARTYMWLAGLMERGGAGVHRERLLSGLSGRVVEVGAGHGPNFTYYPSTVTEVLAVEPDATLRAHAESAAKTAPVPVAVVAGHADQLAAEDGSMDAAVTSLVLCTVPDPAHALAEIARVLKPGGELRFYEHVRSPRAVLGRTQDLITPLWKRAAGGCHPNRDTVTAIQEAGFEVDSYERIPFGFMHVLGIGKLADRLSL